MFLPIRSATGPFLDWNHPAVLSNFLDSILRTRYGGTLEFTTEDNAYLVDWTPRAVGDGAHPYPASGVWADPDLDQAAELMREVFANP